MQDALGRINREIVEDEEETGEQVVKLEKH